MDIYFCLELPSKLDAFLAIGSDPDHFIINEKDSSPDEEVPLSETLGECLEEKGPQRLIDKYLVGECPHLVDDDLVLLRSDFASPLLAVLKSYPLSPSTDNFLKLLERDLHN